MSLFNQRKINTLREIASTILFLAIILFTFSSTAFANLQDPNDFDGDGLPNTIDASPGTADPLAGTTNFNILNNNFNGNYTATTDTDTTYTPLAPLPGLEGAYDTTGACPLGKYMNIMIGLILGIAAVLAMVMIVSGGIQYMTSELISSKEAGKDQIKNAILGLLLALGAYLILNTINPTLLKICLNEIPKISITQITEQEQSSNRAGNGICAPIPNSSSSPCTPANLASAFQGSTNAPAPFSTLAAQASAICYLESHGVTGGPSVDKCTNGEQFSFGLFQINAAAHRNSLPAASQCAQAFNVPSGNQGVHLSNGNWSCTINQPAYNTCKAYLNVPANNIAYAVHLQATAGNHWGQWSTYGSCDDSGEF